MGKKTMKPLLLPDPLSRRAVQKATHNGRSENTVVLAGTLMRNAAAAAPLLRLSQHHYLCRSVSRWCGKDQMAVFGLCLLGTSLSANLIREKRLLWMCRQIIARVSAVSSDMGSNAPEDVEVKVLEAPEQRKKMGERAG